MFGVTDATEGWWVEIAQEGQWVAERVADNAAGMRANAYRIGRVDFNRPNDFMFSDDLLSYARARGWSTGDGQSFDFARVYGDPAKSQATWNTHREERVEQLLRDHLPQITVPHLMAILRDHYEGTARDLTQGFRSGSPHHTMERAVCNMSTELGVIFQSRGWLPAEIGAVSWRAMTTPCSSVFVPWYLGHEQVPAAYEKGTNAYTPGSAYWVFRRLSETVDANYGRLIGPVRSHWSQFESQEFADQAPLENSALGIYFFDPSFARSVLTAYSNSRALRVLQDAEQFLSASSGQTHRSDWTARLF
jgi:dipeptidase